MNKPDPIPARLSYDTDENGLFLPEYVNVFGVPLSISETGEGGDVQDIITKHTAVAEPAE